MTGVPDDAAGGNDSESARDDVTAADARGFTGPMCDWLPHRVAAMPDRRAFIHAVTGDSWIFHELDAFVDETADQLAALGVKVGDHPGVVLTPGIDYVRLIHAATRLGAVLVPLSDRLTAGKIGRNVEFAGMTTLVCGESTESTTVEATTDVPVISVDGPRWEDVINLSSIVPKRVEPMGWSLSETMLLLFTSGTIGTPKAVRLTMGNLLANAVAGAFRVDVSCDGRWLVTLSLHHMGGIGPILHGPLYGTTVVLREGFDAGGAADDIGKYDVTGVSLVPTMLTRMLDSRGTLSDSFRTVLLGSAPAPDELIERYRNYSVPVHPTYGMTETVSQVATATPREAFDDVGTVGQPFYFTDLRVVDEDGTPVEPGTLGELVVSGPTVPPGYYRNSEATADAFSDAGLRTGDIGYRDDDGLLYVLNREDDRVITGGENVDPGEVAAVLRDHPDIDDAIVLRVPDAEWGKHVTALVVPADPGNPPSDEDLDIFCHERLVGFKCPRLVATADEFPRAVLGTIDREAVRERLVAAEPIAEAEPEHATDYDDTNGDAGDGGDDDDESDGSEADSGEMTPASDADEATIDDAEGGATVAGAERDGDEAEDDSETNVDGAERDDAERAEGDTDNGDIDADDTDGGDDGDEFVPDRDE